MKKFTNYSGLPMRELLEDEVFIKLVNQLRNDPMLQQEWEMFLLNHPGESAKFSEAAVIIELAGGTPIASDSLTKNSTWQKIAAGIKRGEQSVPLFRKRRTIPVWKVAAIFLLFLSAGGAAIWFFSNRKAAALQANNLITRQSGPVKLPDQSLVTLGTHATLTYKKDWANDPIREVWLSGEAHFEVNHLNIDSSRIKAGERFIVHVGKEMEVEVLGTVFTIKHTSGKTSVELKTGSVKIGLKNRKRDYIWLQPGEKIELDTLTRSVVRSKVVDTPAPEQETNESFVELNNTSVVEIIKLIESNFHKKVIVQDSSILGRKIDGLLPMKKESDVLFIISNILNVIIDDTDPGIIVIGAK